MLRSLLLILLFLSATNLWAQISFEQILLPSESPRIIPNFAVLEDGLVAFSDIDGNGTEDMLLTGKNASNVLLSILYTNDGTGNFTEFSRVSIEGVEQGAIAFADVNGNGSHDLLITGQNSSDERITKLYINDGTGNYTEAPDTPFEGVRQGAISVVDVDGNGTQDILITGENDSDELIAKLYINDGAGIFTEVTGTPFEGVIQGSIAFSDVDGNGGVDVLIAGFTGLFSNSITKLYLNDGTGNFTEDNDTPFEGLFSNAIGFSDVDGNGTEDLLMTGLNNSGLEAMILYTNDGAGNFSEISEVPFEGTYYGSISFSDVDGNGSQDVLITGSASHGLIAKLYINDGEGSFAEKPGTAFEGVEGSSVAFSDVDANGTADVIIVGKNDSGEFVSNFYLNDGSGIFYEVKVGPFEAVYFGSTAFSDIDGDGAQDVLITGAGYNGPISKLYRNDGAGNFTEVEGTPFEALDYSSIAFSDINDNGIEDLLITGQDSLSRIFTSLYTNDGAGNFTKIEGTPFDPVHNGSVAFADVDGNGSEDVLLTGTSYGLEDFEAIAKLYLNDGNGNFTESKETPFQSVYNSSIAFADVDANGTKDVLITGLTNSKQRIATLYLNDGSGNFTAKFGTPFVGISLGAVAFSDVDRNGTQDVLLSGQNAAGEYITKLYTNDGEGNFSEVFDTPFEGLVNSAIAFRDVDGNGSKDVLITGIKSADDYMTLLYINDGSGNFTEVVESPFENVAGGSISFADVNNDRKPDVLITGINDAGRRISYLYRNTTDLTITSNTDEQISSKFILYPNPANTYLTISGEFFHPISGSIIDLNGKEIKRFKLHGNENAVDLSGLTSGLFILSFQHNGEVVRERFVKK